jgi:hypothetical protein
MAEHLGAEPITDRRQLAQVIIAPDVSQRLGAGGKFRGIAVVMLAGAAGEVQKRLPGRALDPAPLDQRFPPFGLRTVGVDVGPVNRSSRLDQDVTAENLVRSGDHRQQGIQPAGGPQGQSGTAAVHPPIDSQTMQPRHLVTRRDRQMFVDHPQLHRAEHSFEKMQYSLAHKIITHVVLQGSYDGYISHF